MGNHGKKHLVTPEQFVRAVMENKEVPAIAQALGLGEASVRVRIKRFRKWGIKLPDPTRKFDSLRPNTKAMNDIIKSYKGN